MFGCGKGIEHFTSYRTRQMKTKLLFFFLLTLVNISSIIAQPTLLWQKSLGGSEDDFVSAIEQTNDSGYIVLGWVHSNDGDVSGNHGMMDGWITKLSSNVRVDNMSPISGLTIFPNPAKNKITLTSLSSDIGKEYRICDVTGHLVEQGIITSENQNIILSLLSSGTYILKINGYAFQKIMLQKE